MSSKLVWWLTPRQSNNFRFSSWTAFVIYFRDKFLETELSFNKSWQKLAKAEYRYGVKWPGVKS